LRAFTYLERVGTSEEGKGFEAAAKRNSHYRQGMPMTMLKAHTDAVEERNGNKLPWVFGSFGIGAAVWFLMLISAKVDQPEMNRLLSGEKVKSDGLFKECFFLLPRRGFFFTPLFIDLNILVFLGMVLAGMGFVSFGRSDLLALGGNFRPAVQNGEIWRLVTSMFIHGGVMHLAGNIFGLMLAGVLLEAALGSIPFAVCYFICGIAGSIASVVWHKATVSIGASGAIFGLWGVLLGLSLLKSTKVPIGRKEMMKAALFILGYNLLFGLLSGGIDNADHIGGLVCGILIGVLGGIFPNLLGPGRTTARREHKRAKAFTI
jgi:membrane associated rhomboid family serine protease